MQFLLRTVTHFLVLSLLLPYAPVYAANITDVPGLVPDGSTNTVTDRAPNNTPIVNIAAPSAGGVSLNNFSDYNVSSQKTKSSITPKEQLLIPLLPVRFMAIRILIHRA